MPSRPTMFIGSSVEGLVIAQALQAELEHDVDATIWSQGAFGLSEGTLESLVASVHRYDFAALVLTPDDLVTTRGETTNAPRDNVLFETGLFMGALGRSRTFLVAPRDERIRLPSDLAGIALAQFNERDDGNLRAAIGPVAYNIRVAIKVDIAATTATSDEMPGDAAAVPVATAADPTIGVQVADQSPSGAETGTAGADLARLLEGVEQLLADLEPAKAGGRLSGDHAKLYGALLNGIGNERPDDPLLAALSEPKETAISGVFQMTNGEARTGLSLMRSALLSSS